MYSTRSIISFFTDFFRKDEDSNLYKLIDIYSSEFSRVKDTNDLIIRWRNIDEAQGVALDLIGENINQPRGKATDEVYRILLKSKIARNLSDGTINTIIQVIAVALSADVKEILIVEGWEENPEARPSIKMMQLPFDKLIASGIDPMNFITLVKRTVAGGVTVESIELEGTFELGDALAPNNVDNERGFGDANDESIGGYFGLMYSPNTNDDLPI